MKDILLIEGLGKKDKVVFDYVFNYYYSSLCVFSFQYIKDRSVVEDLVQDFFVTIWLEAPRLHFGTSIKSYLFSGIKNRCLDYQKHQKVSEKYKTYLLFNSEIEDDSFEHYFAETELRQAIEKSLVKLPPRCREIFELSRASKLTNQEISDQLGISKRTVEVQISNALKIFRKELSEYLPLLLISWLIG